jgi:hypothetical protein
MNPCYVTPRGAKTYESVDEVRAAWTDSAEFRIYHYAQIITKADTNRLLRAKFTHVRVVWQNAYHRVMHCDIELKEILNGVPH